MANKTFEANIYTPDWRFIAVLKDYISIVWTDRYYEAGDFELILPLTKENLQIYSVDNYIVCNQSDKIMIIESIITSVGSDGYKMKVTGHSAEILLRRRVTANQLLINISTDNINKVEILNKQTNDIGKSHFAGALLKAFEECFDQDGVEMMSENNADNAILMTGENRKMPSIRFAGVISDPFNHIVNAIGNIDSYGDEYYDIIQSLCEAKDIGFAIYRNYEKEIDRTNENELTEVDDIKKARYYQANSPGLFDLVLYDGWNLSGDYLVDNGVDMETKINGHQYWLKSGIIFSVEYLNLQASDSNYSAEEYKNFIFVKGDEINNSSSASVDVALRTANFTEAYTDEDSKFYLASAKTTEDYGIFKRETFGESGISRGLNTRRKYASRLKAKGSKLLRDKKAKMTLSCEIGNANNYIYREDYYLGDLVKVKDSMDNSDIFRVTEEIISCDSSGLKTYPTLVLYDPYKYVEDDSMENLDDSPRVLVYWKFEGGHISDAEKARDIWLGTNSFYNKDDLNHLTTRRPLYGSGCIPPSTDPGTIIDTIPSADQLEKDVNRAGGDIQKFADNMIGVVTYQTYGDFIAFPSELGTPNTDPNEQGDYNLSKEHGELRYWYSGYSRFIPHQESIGAEDGTECIGEQTFYAHWSPEYYKITFDHGTGGRFTSSAFTGSYAKTTDVFQSPPDFNSANFYKRTRNWYTDSWVYDRVYSVPIGWFDPSSSSYWQNYYTDSKPIDKVFKDTAYNVRPSEPGCTPDSGYTRASNRWEPQIVPATEDATYTAQWKAEDESEEEEDEDDERNKEDKEDSDETWVPVKHTNNVLVGLQEDDQVDIERLGIMATFRSTGSRLFDVFLPVNGKMTKISDGPDQHGTFLYQREIGNGIMLQSFWKSGGSGIPGVSFLRTSDWECIANFYPGLSDGSELWNSSFDISGFRKGTCSAEVAFSTAPAVSKIKGYKALTSNPVPEGSEWPQNKIYKREYINNKWVFTVVNEKPSGWDNDGYYNYFKYTQVGARYGICTCCYDDLGVLFNPLWVRLGIIDDPIVPFIGGDMPYDTKYCHGIGDITSYKDDEYIRNRYNWSGWVWREISDEKMLRMQPYNTGSVLLGDLFSSMPEFHYDSIFGSMFRSKDGETGLINQPSDWSTKWQEYRWAGNGNYNGVDKDHPWASEMFSTWSTSYFMGPHFTGSQGNYDYFGTSLGIHAPILKDARESGSIIVTIKGYTQTLTVKPGTTAVFKVNAWSLVLTATFVYEWTISYDGGITFTSLNANSNTVTLTATEEMDGAILYCDVIASYNALGEEIRGNEKVGPMHLYVDESGTDGVEPSDQDEKNKEDLENSSSTSSWDGSDASKAFIDETYDSNGNKKYKGTAYHGNSGGKYTFTYTGDGDPYAGFPTIYGSEDAYEYFNNSDDWELTGYTAPSGGSGSGNSAGSLGDNGTKPKTDPTTQGENLANRIMEEGYTPELIDAAQSYSQNYGTDGITNYLSGMRYAEFMYRILEL